MHLLSDATHFDVATLRKLQVLFTDIAESDVDDGIIDGNELTDAMGLESSCLLARTIFRIFDATQQKRIDFSGWCRTISALSPHASLEEKIRFSFMLYDLNGDGSIDVEELRSMLEAAVLDENILNLTKEQVKEWCDYTLSTVDRDGNGKIDYEEYKSMVENSTKFLESFTLDIHELAISYITFRATRDRSQSKQHMMVDGPGKLTDHEVDQRLHWFRSRQKPPAGDSATSESSAGEDEQGGSGKALNQPQHTNGGSGNKTNTSGSATAKSGMMKVGSGIHKPIPIEITAPSSSSTQVGGISVPPSISELPTASNGNGVTTPMPQFHMTPIPPNASPSPSETNSDGPVFHNERSASPPASRF